MRAAGLAWYDRSARAFPWRVPPDLRRAGRQADPYAVWLSEIMLQQTTTAHAEPYFLAFMNRWPTVQALAAAETADVMAAWAGLGYYARARNLLACAREVAEAHGGRFPSTEAELRSLPGVGAYTAAAVAAIAFDAPANVVDGNVERVVSRLFAVSTPFPAGKSQVRDLAGGLVSENRPGDWAQALMDLGAVVCTPRTPDCGRCPLAFACRAHRAGRSMDYPVRVAKPERPLRRGVALVVLAGDEVGLVRRPPRGLLGGMLGLPTGTWGGSDLDRSVLSQAPKPARDCGAIRHVFTHFELELLVHRVDLVARQGAFAWTPTAEAAAVLPTVFRKALRAALA